MDAYVEPLNLRESEYRSQHRYTVWVEQTRKKHQSGFRARHLDAGYGYEPHRGSAEAQTVEQAKETARLKEESEFLSEAGAFFAASRGKSTKI